ncbi:ABC transporter substrate-binding protein [Clostridium sp. YIM B02555]|uniref:ABC transporter substrate-binding protein n=1 Tax=Clostridium sp. YIM B02555 TaxID=2911968 RepID=UPI001EECFFFD|nr:ABC transporter substrate-binding protein [Clostridium sp. YIM B02555]
MKVLKLISGLGIALTLLTGCGNSSGTGSSSSGSTDSSKVDLSKVTIVVGETGWKSKEAGFKQAGLDNTPYKVEYVNFQGGNLQLEAMAASHLDLALTSEIPPIFASQAQNGGNFKIIGIQQGTTLQQELVVPKDSPIKNVSDLKGKQVAYVDSTTAHYFLLKMLEKAGLSWSDITPVKLSTSDGLTALIGGKVDALASYGNAIISAKQNGATTLASAKDILSGNFPIEATPDAIADPGKHAAIVDYLERYNKFYEWSRQNEDKWAKTTADNTKQPVEQAIATLKEGEEQKPSKIVATSKEAIASEQDIANAFNKAGVLKNKVDVSSFWSNAFDDEIKKFSK